MTYRELVYDAQYFKNHCVHWTDIAADLETRRQAAESAKCNTTSLYATLVPGFAEVHDKVADTIIDKLLGRGARAGVKTAELLELSCRTYLNNEAANTAEAKKILDEVGF